MKILEKKLWEEPKTEEDKKVVFLLSFEKTKKYSVAIMEATPIMDFTNAVYLFPEPVSEKIAREAYNKIYDKLKN